MSRIWSYEQEYTASSSWNLYSCRSFSVSAKMSLSWFYLLLLPDCKEEYFYNHAISHHYIHFYLFSVECHIPEYYSNEYEQVFEPFRGFTECSYRSLGFQSRQQSLRLHHFYAIVALYPKTLPSVLGRLIYSLHYQE